MSWIILLRSRGAAFQTLLTLITIVIATAHVSRAGIAENKGGTAAPVEYFVSVDGNDTAPGTAAEPVETLARALQLERAARAAGRAVTVTVRGGIYYLPEALRFTPADSGEVNQPVVWRAASGETPVLSGGTRLPL